MTIRYADTPQLHYGKQSPDNWRQRFPSNAQPIASAPERGSAVCWIFEPSGDGYRSMFHKGNWMKLQPERDSKTGAVHWRASGERVAQPVAWLPGNFEPPSS